MRRLPPPPSVNLKCLTAFVVYVSAGSSPASARARSSSLPAGPTKGSPPLSSTSPWPILHTPRLLPHQNNPRSNRPPRKNSLTRLLIQVTPATRAGGRAQPL